jgi:RNA polymerase sigma-70 factor (ECF subfamily)
MNKNKVFEDIYNEYYKEILRFCFFKLKNKDEAEDLVSEVFIKAYSHFAKFDGNNARAWLYKIARNSIYDRFKAYENKNRLYTDDESFTDENNPEKKILINEDYKDLLNSIEKLPEFEKEAVTLRYIQELDYAEIAKIMGKTVNAVKILVTKGLKKLKVEDDDKKLKDLTFMFIPSFSLETQSKIYNNLFLNHFNMPVNSNVPQASMVTSSKAVLGAIAASVVVGTICVLATLFIVGNNSNNSKKSTVVITATSLVTPTEAPTKAPTSTTVVPITMTDTPVPSPTFVPSPTPVIYSVALDKNGSFIPSSISMLKSDILKINLSNVGIFLYESNTSGNPIYRPTLDSMGYPVSMGPITLTQLTVGVHKYVYYPCMNTQCIGPYVDNGPYGTLTVTVK